MSHDEKGFHYIQADNAPRTTIFSSSTPYAITCRQVYTIQLMLLPKPSDYNNAPFLTKPTAPLAFNLRHDHSTLNRTTAVYNADLLRRIVARRHYIVVHFI